MELERAGTPLEPDDYRVASGDALERMLKSTRDAEFTIGIDVVRAHAPSGRWLDIGCSYGWFLQHIRVARFEPFGVEPSPTACSKAREAFGPSVALGEFPAALAEGGLPSTFDVVSSMDVLEHIQSPGSFLDAARELCAEGGVFLLKVPSNEGLLFRAFSMLSTRRRHAALGRMWQVDFNYPHWHYYSPESLRCLLARHGFEVIAERRLPFAFFSTAADRVRSYERKRENTAVLGAKVVAAYALIALSYALRSFDGIVVLARSANPPARPVDYD